jgi:hypothetical protein
MPTIDDDDDVVRDGESVRVPIHLMDGVQRQIAFDARTAARDAMIRRAQNAWRHGAADAASKPVTVTDLDKLRDAARTARATWIKQMCDAWKTDARRKPYLDPEEPKGSAGQYNEQDPRKIGRSALSIEPGGQPDNSSPPEVMRRHLQGRRDEAWQSRNSELENAWRGQTDPARATAIERQREEWLGK